MLPSWLTLQSKLVGVSTVLIELFLTMSSYSVALENDGFLFKVLGPADVFLKFGVLIHCLKNGSRP